MSILAYVGLPGSGKSYDVVANQILPALKQGRHVCTNIPLHADKIKEITPNGTLTDFPTVKVQSTPEAIFEYCTPGTVLVLDEVWRLFPAGLKANNVPEPFRKLLAEHRHMVDEHGNSTQIVLVTQDLAQIAAFARQLVEQTVNHTKLTSIGAAKSYRIDIYAGAVTGTSPPKSQRIREIFGRYENKITDLYQSHTMSQSATGAVNEKGADSRGNILKRPLIWIGLALIPLTFMFAIPLVKKGLSPKGTQTKNEQKPQFVQQSVTNQAASLSQGTSDASPLSCVELIIGDTLKCDCLDSNGSNVLTGTQCHNHMMITVGNWGGSTAKSENITYLNSRAGNPQPAT
jgi:zona occludens toxin (predicted ATPase)